MIKKSIPWIVFSLLFLLIIVGYKMKDSMDSYLSKMVQEQNSPEITKSGEVMIDSLYNYSINELNYEITFLEFGAKGCSACKRMETVMDEIRTKYPNRINVVFLNVLKPENHLLMKLYGIAAIPTQVLLDKKGREFYRHSGYISSLDLAILF